MTGSLLWVDEDSHAWTAIVSRIARKGGMALVGKHSLGEAYRYLRSDLATPQALLLDLIVPIDETGRALLDKQTSGLSSEDERAWLHRFSGLCLLREFPWLAERTVILSIVPLEAPLEQVLGKLAREIPIFRKAEVGGQLQELEEALRAAGKRGGAS